MKTVREFKKISVTILIAAVLFIAVGPAHAYEGHPYDDISLSYGQAGLSYGSAESLNETERLKLQRANYLVDRYDAQQQVVDTAKASLAEAEQTYRDDPSKSNKKAFRKAKNLVSRTMVELERVQIGVAYNRRMLAKREEIYAAVFPPISYCQQNHPLQDDLKCYNTETKRSDERLNFLPLTNSTMEYIASRRIHPYCRRDSNFYSEGECLEFKEKMRWEILEAMTQAYQVNTERFVTTKRKQARNNAIRDNRKVNCTTIFVGATSKTSCR